MTPNHEQVPMRVGAPHTDDAYALDRFPIKVDLRVPMFGHENPLSDGSTVDQALYCAALSAPDLTLHLRGGRWWATGHYRGEKFVTGPAAASMSGLLRQLSLAAAEIDRRIGGIRVRRSSRR